MPGAPDDLAARYYIESSNFGLEGLWFSLKNLWSNWWILFFIPFAAFLKPNPRIWFWIVMLVGALFSTSTSFYGQYYIILMPFWALLGAVGIQTLASRIADWSGRPTRWVACFIAGVVVLLVLQPDVTWLKCTRERFVEKKMTGYPFRESQTVAARVAQLSSPDDFVFIAGSEPQILYYAQRFSPTRFITAYSLMIPSPVALKYQQEAMFNLQRRPPSLIVFVSSGISWTRHEATPLDFFVFLNNFIAENYDLVGGYVVNGQRKYWSEPLGSGELADASLILYKRKQIHPDDGAFDEFLARLGEFRRVVKLRAAAAFDARRNLVENPDALDRIFPHGRLAAQHDRISLLENGVGHVGDFRARGHGRFDHAFEHVRGDDDGPADAQACLDDAALHDGQFFVRNFDAQIAARPHDGVGFVDDGLQIGDGLLVFNLGDDERMRFAFCKHFPELEQVAGFAREGQRDEIHSEFEAKLDALDVLGGR